MYTGMVLDIKKTSCFNRIGILFIIIFFFKISDNRYEFEGNYNIIV